MKRLNSFSFIFLFRIIYFFIYFYFFVFFSFTLQMPDTLVIPVPEKKMSLIQLGRATMFKQCNEKFAQPSRLEGPLKVLSWRMAYLQVFLTEGLNLHTTDAAKETFPHIIGFCNWYAFSRGFYFYHLPCQKISHKKKKNTAAILTVGKLESQQLLQIFS